MVGNQHHLVLERHLGPLQQRDLVLEHIARHANQAVAILQREAIEAIAQQVLHLARKAGIGISDILFIDIDHTQVLHLVGVGGLEEGIQFPVGTL